MKEVKTSGEYKIYEKRSGRYAIKDSKKQYVNGDEKAGILASAGLVTIPEPKKPQPVEENAAPEESNAEAAAQESVEETPAEE